MQGRGKEAMKEQLQVFARRIHVGGKPGFSAEGIWIAQVWIKFVPENDRPRFSGGKMLADEFSKYTVHRHRRLFKHCCLPLRAVACCDGIQVPFTARDFSIVPRNHSHL